MKLSIIIPAYNEENTILEIILKVLEVKLHNNIEKEIIVINDCSTDKTLDIVNNLIKKSSNFPLKVVSQKSNMGKGAAIQKGIKLSDGDFIIIQDADLEYSPEDYNPLLKPITDGFADVVYGSRFKGANPHRILFFWHSIGNKFLTFISNMFTNLNLTDMETCYKMFRSEIIKNIDLKENHFGFEPEVTAKISRLPAIRIYEIGISYYGRTYSEGKKITWRDGLRAIYVIVKYNIFKK